MLVGVVIGAVFLFFFFFFMVVEAGSGLTGLALVEERARVARHDVSFSLAWQQV